VIFHFQLRSAECLRNLKKMEVRQLLPATPCLSKPRPRMRLLIQNIYTTLCLIQLSAYSLIPGLQLEVYSGYVSEIWLLLAPTVSQITHIVFRSARVSVFASYISAINYKCCPISTWRYQSKPSSSTTLLTTQSFRGLSEAIQHPTPHAGPLVQHVLYICAISESKAKLMWIFIQHSTSH
jgi:hypothetical protein